MRLSSIGKLGRCDELCRCLLVCVGVGGHGNPRKLTPHPESLGGVDKALGEQDREEGGRGCSREWVAVTP